MLAIANSQVNLALAAHACKDILCYTRYSNMLKLSNKQSGKVIYRCDSLTTTHNKSQKAV